MDIASVMNQGRGTAKLDGDNSAAFREADFMAIMLSEITNQDPFEPTETAKMVENMQKLQELSNSKFEKFRDDIRWAQDLVGKDVTANQQFLTAEEQQGLEIRGVLPDPGFGIVEGQVDSYKVVGENVWISIDGRDYPIDNIQQIKPPGEDTMGYANLADNLLGNEVTYIAPDLTLRSGKVERVTWVGDEINLTVDGEVIPFTSIKGLSL